MAVKAKTEMQKLDERVLRTLAELGETRVTEDAITIQGTKLVLPETMTPRDGIAFLRQYIEQQEEETAFTRVFNYRPWDVSAALQRALMKVTGSSGIAQATWSFFGKEPPELHTIQVGVNETLQVPAGLINVPMLNGQIQIGSHQHREYGPIGFVHVTAPRRFKAHIEGLFRVVEDELKAHSIYRTKAFDGQVEPEFLDLSGIDPRQVIYSDDTLQQLQANIWSVVENTSTLREMNIPRKRAVLLEGPYGTGKTLAAYLTAQKAVANGWTFIYARPGRDDLSTVMGTARLYQPSVVFFEDVDTISSGDETHDQVTKLLDLFDGITAKTTEILCVLTTNHKERIHKAMVRPGRLDAMVHIGALDQSGVTRMIEATVPEDLLGDLDYEAIGQAMGVGTEDAFLPSFVREAIDRTMRYAISREGKRPTHLATEDFVRAAEGLKPQLQLMAGAKEGRDRESVGVALRQAVRDAVDGAGLVRPGDDQVFANVVANDHSNN
jgi:transitional endoplasmic reticulum ATPase